MRRAWVGGLVVLVVAMLLGGCGDLRGLLTAEPSAQPAPVPAPEPQAAAPPTTSQVSASATVTPAPAETPSPAPSATAADSPEPTQPSSAPEELSEQERVEAEVVELTNAERAAAGCQDVLMDDRLVEAARGHSADMVERGFFDHTNPDGDDPWDRARASGYDWLASENIAWGYGMAEDVVEGWMNSSGHRRNILDCDVVSIGVGVADLSGSPYWTQMFGRR